MTRLPLGVDRPAAGPSAARPGRWWLIAFGAAVAVQLIVVYSPQGPGGPQVPGLDKVVHLLIFAGPVLAALMAGLRWPWVLGIFAAHAPVSELTQHFALPHRTGDPWDMVADLVGVALGYLAFLVWNRRQH
jgi:hypothetical protein